MVSVFAYGGDEATRTVQHGNVPQGSAARAGISRHGQPDPIAGHNSRGPCGLSRLAVHEEGR